MIGPICELCGFLQCRCESFAQQDQKRAVAAERERCAKIVRSHLRNAVLKEPRAVFLVVSKILSEVECEVDEDADG